MSMLMSSLIKPALVMCGVLMATASFNARADRNPNSNGSCPSGYTKGTNSAGKATCYSPRDMENKAKQQERKKKK